VRIRVYYEDTDAAGIVYYANYLKFCERARSELFFSNDLSPQSDEGYFVVKKLEAEYKKPAKLGDWVTVDTKMIDKRAASITLLQRVMRDDEILFTMTVRLAYLANGRPSKIPPHLYSLISAWESES